MVISGMVQWPKVLVKRKNLILCHHISHNPVPNCLLPGVISSVCFSTFKKRLINQCTFNSLLKAGANGQIIKVLISMYSKLDAYIKLPQSGFISNSYNLNLNESFNRACCKFRSLNKNSTPGISLAGPIHCITWQDAWSQFFVDYVTYPDQKIQTSF